MFTPHLCHMSCVRCEVWGVRCNFFFFFFLFFFLGQSVGASRWRVCYQRGQPHLFFYVCCLKQRIFLHLENVYHEPEIYVLTLSKPYHIKHPSFLALPVWAMRASAILEDNHPHPNELLTNILHPVCNHNLGQKYQDIIS